MKLYKLILFLIIVAFSSCNGSGDFKTILEERDSLKRVNEQQTLVLNNYVKVMDAVNSAIDSIAHQEKSLFSNDNESPISRDDVLVNLERFQNIINFQSDKIKKLEKELAGRGDTVNIKGQMMIIENLKRQLEEKNQLIARLNNQLADKNVTIADLKKTVENQEQKINNQAITINQLTETNRRQVEVLAHQDEMLNNGYVLVGSKDDLKRKGIIKRGKILPDAALDRTKFFKVDIRKWTEVTFSAKRPRILTNMPTSSYELTTTGNKSFTLRVTNAADFWRISNYLVIQTD